MTRTDHLLFWSLAAIWGSSFLFMRIAAPHLGAVFTAEGRVFCAWVVMALFFLLVRKPLPLRQHWRSLAFVGAFNSAVPFALFSYAAIHLPAGYSAILNALVPLWAAVFAWPLLGNQPHPRVLVAGLIAMAGTAIMVRLGPVQFTLETLLAALACVAATACYGISGVWAKRYLGDLPGYVTATQSQLFAWLTLAPLLPLQAIPSSVPTSALVAVLALGVLCSGVAYVIYFELFRRMDAVKASTITFVVPLFAILWASVFLGETLTWSMLGGFALVLCATALVMQLGPFRPKSVPSA